MSIISKNTSRTAVPAARSDDLVVTESQVELLVYDQRSHHIHHLNRMSAVVWRLCDGRRAVDEIGRLAQEALGEPVSDELVRFALIKLEDAGLLAQPLSPDIRASSQSRRTFLRRAAIGGAVAVPAIVSITAPVMAATVHNCGLPCTCNDDCNSKGADCPLCSADNKVCCKQGPNVDFPCGPGGAQPCGGGGGSGAPINGANTNSPANGATTNSLVQDQAVTTDTPTPTEAPPPPPPADAGGNGNQSNAPATDTSGQGSGDQSVTTDPPTPVPTDTPVPPPPPPPAAPDTSTSSNASTTSNGTTIDPSSGNAPTTNVQNVFPTPPGG